MTEAKDDTVSEVDSTQEIDTFKNVIDLPILDEIDQNMEVATAGAYSTTGLDLEEIRTGAEKWKNTHNEQMVSEFVERLRTVDEVYLLLVGVTGEESDQQEDGAWAWGRGRVEPIEVVMEVFGLC